MTRRMPLLLTAVLALTTAFAAGRTTAKTAPPSAKAVADHARKNFSLSPFWKVSVSPLKAGEVAGFLKGTMTVEAPQGKQDQPLYVSEDGNWYFVGSPHDLTVDPDKDRLSKMKLTGVPDAGPKDAPITFVEYSDLQCPHCKRSHEILKENLGAYKGKIRRIFKNYPLRQSHPWAYPGAVALACAGKLAPKKAAAFTSSVFAMQEAITLENASEKLKEIAKKTGLSGDRFNTCFDNQETKALVLADIAEGDRLGVHGTPTIFINGRQVRGYEWPEVKAVLDNLLNEAK